MRAVCVTVVALKVLSDGVGDGRGVGSTEGELSDSAWDAGPGAGVMRGGAVGREGTRVERALAPDEDAGGAGVDAAEDAGVSGAGVIGTVTEGSAALSMAAWLSCVAASKRALATLMVGNAFEETNFSTCPPLS